MKQLNNHTNIDIIDNNLFVNRHIGSSDEEIIQILGEFKFNNLDEFIQQVLPDELINHQLITTAQPTLEESTALNKLKKYAKLNTVYKNYIGFGYFDTITPAVIKRNVLENPAWYTAYTPYQAEISQGRLEALINFQQMVIDLTGFEVANASLLDEATAAAEAVSMSYKIYQQNNRDEHSEYKYLIDSNIYPQTLDVIKTRAKYLNIQIIMIDISKIDELLRLDALLLHKSFGIFIQNPNTLGIIHDYTKIIDNIKQINPNFLVTMACDIMSLVLFKSPASMGADIAVGSTQRFGIPIGFGGPAAAYFASKDEYKRLIPGRIIGVSIDKHKRMAFRMSLQTREQHIRREKATSNICTAQVLLANMASFYAVYHGPKGLKQIARKILMMSNLLYDYLKIQLDNHQHPEISLQNNSTWTLDTIQHKDLKHDNMIFDTVIIKFTNHTKLENTYNQLLNHAYLVLMMNDYLAVTTHEASSMHDIINIANIILHGEPTHNISNEYQDLINLTEQNLDTKYKDMYRKDRILSHANFNSYHSETKLLRYIKRLELKDISLVHSMIPLGSCTMKLNAASELEGLSYMEFANIHPFAPQNALTGYMRIINELRQQLMQITGFDEISFQSNSGAQGELSGLLAIRRYQESINQEFRNICLIPKSAHGTNPATAQMLGFTTIIINCDDNGNVDIHDLILKVELYKETLSCLMITYPSTHGVFEADIKKICNIIHDNGGMVYMDGANLNALVGLVKPAELGADVSHINLHKTFAIPHGGGGPGMGPIGVKKHLIPFLPKYSIENNQYNLSNNTYAIAAAKYGSASILTISWMYITMLGDSGLKKSTCVAILNANYIATKLKPYYKILFTGKNNFVAHECIIDLRPLKALTGITEIDVAKRLMDYGFHAPTMSFPVAGTLMIEPTESENKLELDNFINAMISIYHEIMAVHNGTFDKNDNPLKNAPHTLYDLSIWHTKEHSYTINTAIFPNSSLINNKIFPAINRIDDAYGDRNFICSCPDFDTKE